MPEPVGQLHSAHHLEMVRTHFNEPVLLGDKLARVVGYGEDDRDCYLIVQYPYGRYEKQGGRIWHTCVGGYIWLRSLVGQGHVRRMDGEDWDDYRRCDSLLELNGAPKEPEFIVKIKH